MSKCREAFEQWLCTTASQSPVDIWQAAWNARGEVDAKKLEAQHTWITKEAAAALIYQEQCK